MKGILKSGIPKGPKPLYICTWCGIVLLFYKTYTLVHSFSHSSSQIHLFLLWPNLEQEETR
jgi:hypothetical protein